MPTVLLNRPSTTDLLETAKGILIFHFPTQVYSAPFGRKLCVGCVEQWGRYVLWPCYQADWALLVRRKTGGSRTQER